MTNTLIFDIINSNFKGEKSVWVMVISMESELNEKPNGKVKAFLIQPYGTRYFALYDGEDLICVTVYKKGAMEVKRRLEIASNLATIEE